LYSGVSGAMEDYDVWLMSWLVSVFYDAKVLLTWNETLDFFFVTSLPSGGATSYELEFFKFPFTC
jgi:hypothetical protein